MGAYISPFSRKECLKGKLNKPAAAPERLQRLHKNKKKNFNSINLIKQLKNMSCFAGKTLLITGGTGSFGNMVLKRFLESDIKEIRIFSRDEKKQDDMRHHLQSTYSANIASKVKFYIGDVRDRKSVDIVMRSGVDYVFSAAALKQVPSCEFFPMQAVETNVYGTNNVLESAIEYGVKNIVVLSTDKAAYPINSMGISKAMMEKVATAKVVSLALMQAPLSVALVMVM